MSKNNFDQTVGSLFDGMEHLFSSKTVVGEPKVIGDTIIIPLVDVSFGMGAGAFAKDKSDSGAGGVGGKMSPSAVLVIQNGETKVVNVKAGQDPVSKIIDMVPPTVNKVSSLIKNRGKEADPEVEAVIDEEKNAESVRKEF